MSLVEPMYIAGRLRTASRPSSTVMDSAPYVSEFVLTDFLFSLSLRLGFRLVPAAFKWLIATGSSTRAIFVCTFADTFFFLLFVFTALLPLFVLFFVSSDNQEARPWLNQRGLLFVINEH